MVTAIAIHSRARNADVHHNLNVSNPVPKVYTIYGNVDSVCIATLFI